MCSARSMRAVKGSLGPPLAIGVVKKLKTGELEERVRQRAGSATPLAIELE